MDEENIKYYLLFYSNGYKIFQEDCSKVSKKLDAINKIRYDEAYFSQAQTK